MHQAASQHFFHLEPLGKGSGQLVHTTLYTEEADELSESVASTLRQSAPIV